jgi:L-threonylcarbamoyladenylate synthase
LLECHDSAVKVIIVGKYPLGTEVTLKTIPLASVTGEPSRYREIANVLNDGRLVCFPTSRVYKLAADLNSPTAVAALLQAKRRVKNAPGLVFIAEAKWVEEVAAPISSEARALMDAFWPGDVTLLLEASDLIHPKVRKSLIKAKGWLGVRIPADEVSLGIVREFGRPVLVSSANLAEKQGAYSVAQVRKNFGRTVDLLIDGGDLSGGPTSTLVNLTKDGPKVVRAGAIPAEEIHRVLAG